MKLKTILFLFLAHNSLDIFLFFCSLLSNCNISIIRCNNPLFLCCSKLCKKMGIGKQAFFTFDEYSKTKTESVFLIS